MNDIIDIMEEMCDVLEGMNLGDMVADVIYKKKQEDPDADVEKLEALQKKAEQIPVENDLHKDEKGNWVKPEGYNYSRVPSNVKGSNATDARRNLSKEAADNLRDERINDMLNDYPKAKANSIKRHKEKVESIKEARDLADLVIRAYEKGKIAPGKLQELIDKAQGTPSDASYYHLPKEERNSLINKHNQQYIKDYSVNTDKKRVEEFDGLSPEEKVKKRTQEKLNKKNNASEAFKLIEEAFGLMTSLFEVDDASGEMEDKSKEHNKIRREIKDENGNTTDVVSVADELFPYAGNAKQQFNQKVIAKINDMIEGKATLEDLIQLVRKKHATKKVEESFEEGFQGAIELLEAVMRQRKAEQKSAAIKVLPKRQDAYNKALAHFEKVLSGIHANNISNQSLTKAQQADMNKVDKEVAKTQSRFIDAKEKAGM